MPTLADVVEIAEVLGTKAVFPVKDRCIAVRNRHSSCHKCSEACPAGAVYAEKNKLEFDAAACMSCGACTTACPVEALVPLLPDDETLGRAARIVVEETGGVAVFACARIASKGVGDPAKYAEVPCMARIEESLLVELASEGVRDIVLVDGVCKTCKYRSCVPRFDEVVRTATKLISVQGGQARISRTSEFPDCALVDNKWELLSESRRGFFTSMGTRAADAATETVKYLVGKNPENQVQEKLRDFLQITESGSLPQFSPERRGRLLDSMYAIGEAAAHETAEAIEADEAVSYVADEAAAHEATETTEAIEPAEAAEPARLETRLFGSVEIDEDKCRACTMCTVFCPTGALTKSTIAPEDGVGSYLEFSASDCVQCNLCADACLNKCLTVHPVVSVDELFDFEPRLIHLPDKPKNKGIGAAFRTPKPSSRRPVKQ
ncbi:4Fe-4S binding protein [Adlercreutzia sp. ZJ141]|uniref:4Fe-4S binding protein n=1 Tax=Adlercreutzia sp. ZJ141 TaxID=2709406 RepID=UPI0013ED30B0|nr:4Fe-4S binding protein [Adlercreutzia sp. ZJ141]